MKTNKKILKTRTNPISITTLLPTATTATGGRNSDNRSAIVGTGIRGTPLWQKILVTHFRVTVPLKLAQKSSHEKREGPLTVRFQRTAFSDLPKTVPRHFYSLRALTPLQKIRTNSTNKPISDTKKRKGNNTRVPAPTLISSYFKDSRKAAKNRQDPIQPQFPERTSAPPQSSIPLVILHTVLQVSPSEPSSPSLQATGSQSTQSNQPESGADFCAYSGLPTPQSSVRSPRFPIQSTVSSLQSPPWFPA
jgi:hypothetical protein